MRGLIITVGLLLGMGAGIYWMGSRAEPSSDAPAVVALVVTINPEARVAVEPAPGPLPPQRCHQPIELGLEVFNDSFARAPLRAVALSYDFEVLVQPSPALSGKSRELRTMKIRLNRPAPVEVGLAFDVGPGTADIGWRGATALLVHCIG
jgi:hypothetical protein